MTENDIGDKVSLCPLCARREPTPARDMMCLTEEGTGRAVVARDTETITKYSQRGIETLSMFLQRNIETDLTKDKQRDIEMMSMFLQRNIETDFFKESLYHDRGIERERRRERK